jgi:octaprenyl-diphosphate synthase
MIEQDIADIDASIAKDMQPNLDYLRQVADYLCERQASPLHLKILLLSLKMINYQGQAHIQSGVIFEYIYAATKLHDDTMLKKIRCQDEDLSQGLKGTDSRILVGDFFYSRAFNLMAKLSNMNVVSHLSNAINQYSEGQSLQICQARDADTTEQMYCKRIERKASLYYTCIAQVVSELGDCDETQTQAFCDYSLHLGIAVQIIEETLSCIRGSDADKHKQSNLPLIVIRGLDQANSALRESIQTGIDKQLMTTEMITQIGSQTDALTYTRNRIETGIKQATQVILAFPESIYRQALQDAASDFLAQFNQEMAVLGY